MAEKDITVKGAREHNLKNINVRIPRENFVVVTGLSGSGKSTLAFDTIYAEGQRRYVESLSAYARQFLGVMDKPDLDSIDGLSPAISIEQKTTSKNPRSTVGTVTEVYDYLRLLFARVGQIHCPQCDTPIKPQSAENIVNLILSEEGKKLVILSPVIRGQKGTHERVFDELKKEGFARVRVDGEIYDLDTVKEDVSLERYEKHWIEAVVDRIKVSEDERLRLTDSVEQALKFSKGTVITLDIEKEREEKGKQEKKEMGRGVGETLYSTFGACPNHPHIVFEQPEPRMFSFNSPFGACEECHGIGEEKEISPDLMIPDKNKSILEGGIKGVTRKDLKWIARQLSPVARKYGFNIDTPLSKLSQKQKDVLLYGTPQHFFAKWGGSGAKNIQWEGLIPRMKRIYEQTDSETKRSEIEKLMISKPCPVCKGKRLKDKMLSVKIQDKSIIDTTDMNISKSKEFFDHLEENLTEKEAFIARQILKEIRERLEFLNNVGLSYLTLSRSAGTLSGGEAQRIRLATQIGANLMGVLYVLDEPSIGLHQRDNNKLINTLHNLRDIGNTLIVVEHDEDTIRNADHIIDIGPGAGVEGGHVVERGSPGEIEKRSESLTGKYLSREKTIPVPETRREPRDFITLKNAYENNLQNINVDFPTGVFCGVTGVSGSGKSTLLNQTLLPAMKKQFGMSIEREASYDDLNIPEEIENIIVIDQDPIGKTPRSNPATYTKLFDDIRTIFANSKEAKARGYKEGRFSFNVKGGRCETCKGEGQIKIEMNFLPDVYVTCEDCKGRRYNRETLEVTYKGKNIADVLEMDVQTAYEFFDNHTSIRRKLKTLMDVGLGYIKLGQSSVTLSGGESQRIKLTKELSKFKKGNTLYILDEPTTGLHFEDVKKLIGVLQQLVDKGNSVYIIEHNLDVIKSTDYIIDMGPEGGDGGGEIVAQGTPEKICESKKSHTAEYLKDMLK